MAKVGGCHRERGKPRDAGRNETRHLAVEVQEREDKRCSEKQGKGRRLSLTGVREQQYSAVCLRMLVRMQTRTHDIHLLASSPQQRPASPPSESVVSPGVLSQ